MLDQIAKVAIGFCMVLFCWRMVPPDVFEYMDARKMFVLSVELLMALGAGIVASRRMAETAKSRSVQPKL